MTHRRRPSDRLPEWLWFFIVLPLGLFVTLLFRRRERDALISRFKDRQKFLRRRRYTEPDSIPIDQRSLEVEFDLSGEAAAVDQEPEQLELAEPARRAAAAADAGEPDDLKVIEGIGPAISKLLADQGITTFQKLAAASHEQLDAILTAARLRRLADPTTWPEQAALAAQGRWEDLEALQNRLSAGRRKSG